MCTKDYFKHKGQKRNFGVMGLPPQSPDVNPIEHFCDRLKQKKVKNNPTSVNNL